MFETKRGIICYFTCVTALQPAAKGLKARPAAAGRASEVLRASVSKDSDCVTSSEVVGNYWPKNAHPPTG